MEKKRYLTKARVLELAVEKKAIAKKHKDLAKDLTNQWLNAVQQKLDTMIEEAPYDAMIEYIERHVLEHIENDPTLPDFIMDLYSSMIFRDHPLHGTPLLSYFSGDDIMQFCDNLSPGQPKGLTVSLNVDRPGVISFAKKSVDKVKDQRRKKVVSYWNETHPDLQARAGGSCFRIRFHDK